MLFYGVDSRVLIIFTTKTLIHEYYTKTNIMYRNLYRNYGWYESLINRALDLQKKFVTKIFGLIFKM